MSIETNGLETSDITLLFAQSLDYKIPSPKNSDGIKLYEEIFSEFEKYKYTEKEKAAFAQIVQTSALNMDLKEQIIKFIGLDKNITDASYRHREDVVGFFFQSISNPNVSNAVTTVISDLNWSEEKVSMLIMKAMKEEYYNAAANLLDDFILTGYEIEARMMKDNATLLKACSHYAENFPHRFIALYNLFVNCGIQPQYIDEGWAKVIGTSIEKILLDSKKDTLSLYDVKPLLDLTEFLARQLEETLFTKHLVNGDTASAIDQIKSQLDMVIGELSGSDPEICEGEPLPKRQCMGDYYEEDYI